MRSVGKSVPAVQEIQRLIAIRQINDFFVETRFPKAVCRQSGKRCVILDNQDVKLLGRYLICVHAWAAP
jgi:hypothetical protein